MSPPLKYYLSRIWHFLQLPFAVQWRALLVRLPWLVPLPILHFTSPNGPHPFILYLPSRNGKDYIPIYIFLPLLSSSSEPLPVHLDFHGGGFIMGSCVEQAPFCALLARKTGRIVISVDYRKGPLDRFPAAVKDAEDVLAAILQEDAPNGRFLRDGILSHTTTGISLDTNRLSISGFSSGGNLALNLVTNVPDLDWPCLLTSCTTTIPTLLFYPSFDSRLLPHERPWHGPPSKKPSANTFTSLSAILGPTYLPPPLRSHPRACPGLISTSNIISSAQILLILPEIDTLAEQSRVWVEKMEKEGQAERLVVEKVEGMKHGWTIFPDYFLDALARREKIRVNEMAVDFVNQHGGMG